MNHPPKMSGTKICSRCKRELHVLCFGVDNKNTDGLSSHCRECKVEVSRHTPSGRTIQENRVNKKIRSRSLASISFAVEEQSKYHTEK